MKTGKIVVFTTILIFISWDDAFAQEKELDLEKFIENNFQVPDTEQNYEDIYEALFQWYQSPLNLNAASREDLQSLLILSNLQINDFLHHRAVNGRLLSIYELQSIPSFNLETIYSLLPFVTVRELGIQADNRSLWKRLITEENNYLILRTDRVLQTKRGYRKDSSSAQQYLGDPYRIYAKFRIQHSEDFSFGFTAEKDSGEELVWKPGRKQYGLDFWSFHAQLKNQGRFKNIVLGDYQLQFGQSLLFGAGFALGKGSQTVATARRSNLGILPYTSVLETNFFRGFASTFELSKTLTLTTFYSYNAINASSRFDSTLAESDYFTAIRLNGFHRTESEIAAKNAIESQNFGGNLLFQSKSENLNLGVNYISTIYNKPFQRNQSKYNQFDFYGSRNHNLGVFSNYYWRNFHLFGEAAISRSGGTGAIAGFISSITSDLQASLIVRNYERSFHSFYGTAFGESNRNINEKGVYLGIKFQPLRKFTLAAYYDSFSFPWLKFRADAPSKGNEYLTRLSYNFSRYADIYFQARVENKERNFAQEDNANLYGLANAQKRNYILNLNVNPKGIFSIKTRVQYSEFLFNQQYSNGIALIQDVNFDFGKFRLSTRYAIFETDDFENRQYVYERDVLYAFSIPAYQNTGARSYALLQYKFSKQIQLWFRYAQFNFLEQESIGSGNEEIEGDTRSELKLQLMLRL